MKKSSFLGSWRLKKKLKKNQPCGRSEFDDSFLFETGVIEAELVSLLVSI